MSIRNRSARRESSPILKIAKEYELPVADPSSPREESKIMEVDQQHEVSFGELRTTLEPKLE